METNSQLEIIKDVISEEKRNLFLKTIVTNDITNFKLLYSEILDISETNARHHLKILLKYNLVQKVKVKGTKAIHLQTNPRFITNLRTIYGIQIDTAYIAGLGTLRSESTIQHIDTIFEKGLKYFPTMQTVDFLVTKWEETGEDWDSNLIEKSSAWQGLQSKTLEIKIHKIDMQDFSKSKAIIQTIFVNRLQTYDLVVDVTGGPKIPSLALFKLAMEFGLICYYFPKKGKKEIEKFI